MGVERPTALVVDDDASLRALCRINLELDGFAVREAATLAAAIEAIEDMRPRLVLLDLHLGNEQSSSLLERLRADGIPVAIVTGSADPDEWRAHADAVLAKPFTPQALIEVARRLAV